MSERVALSFIGLSNYSPTTYVWGEDTCATHYMQEALQKFFEPDQLLIAMTPGASEKHEPVLREHLSFERVDIPTGSNEKEWWDVFEAIVEKVPAHARLTIDITHGFRSQPLVALAVALYLEAARDVDVKRIVYGAFDKADDSDATEVLDLTSFLDIIEWSVGARQFLRDGSADTIAGLMKEIQGAAHRTGAEVKPKHASSAATQLKRLTEALSVVRPGKVGEERAEDLVEVLQEVQDDIERVPQLRPLSVLLDQIQDRVAPMQTPSLFEAQGFEAQAEMMQFFLETGQLQQAVTLAREALVSYQALEMGLDPEPVPRDERDESGRGKAEHALGRLADQHEGRSEKEKTLGDLWSKMFDVRNDINHAGMNADPASGDNLARRAQEVVEEVASYVRSAPETPASG